MVRSFQDDALARQCSEAVWIKNLNPENRINNKKEYHQPGDVEIHYEKNENEEVKKRKTIMKEAKKKRAAEIEETYPPTNLPNTNNKNVDLAKKKAIEPTIIDFIKKVRFDNDKAKKKNT